MDGWMDQGATRQQIKLVAISIAIAIAIAIVSAIRFMSEVMDEK
jgi:hypothetical protein